MDSIKFGNFIVSSRKNCGITQRELAKRIGVNTKLIAMWENGICPPCANKILDLSNALGVNVTELLLSKRLPADDKSKNDTEEALHIYAEISAYQLRIETKYRRFLLAVAAVLAITLGIFLIDSFSLVLFIAAIVPILAAICFVASIIFHFMFRRTNKKSSLHIVAGTISFLIFASILCLFVFAFFIGGPTPT